MGDLMPGYMRASGHPRGIDFNVQVCQPRIHKHHNGWRGREQAPGGLLRKPGDLEEDWDWRGTFWDENSRNSSLEALPSATRNRFFFLSLFLFVTGQNHRLDPNVGGMKS